MFRRFLLAWLFAASLAEAAYVDPIFEDVTETETITLHSRGLLAYGTHSNTFHLRNFFARANYQKDSLQFFLTVNGYADTHDPATNYQYVLNNISLYDYGITYSFLGGFYVSPRAAGTYREDQDTLLLMPAYVQGAPAEFDVPRGYLPVHKTGPGVRLGYAGENFEVGYSQGDYRHSIPTGVLAKYRFSDELYARFVMLSEYENPVTFDRSSLRRKFQLGVKGRRTLTPKLGVAFLAETTYHQAGSWRVRLEQAMEHFGMVLAFREIFSTGNDVLFEVALRRRIADLASLGFQYATTGHLYFGAFVDF